MAHLRSIPLLAALTTLSAFSPSAHASFPAGVWGLVDEVTTIVEPGMTEPTMVRIDGLFMVAGHKPDFAQYPGYGEPQSGYMYYKCSEKELATCVMEWKELQAIAGGADNCRGWGDNSLPDNGKVYAGPQLPLVPDLYPLGMGVVKGFGPCEALKAWQMEFPGTTTGDETSTSTSTSTTPPPTRPAAPRTRPPASTRPAATPMAPAPAPVRPPPPTPPTPATSPAATRPAPSPPRAAPPARPRAAPAPAGRRPRAPPTRAAGPRPAPPTTTRVAPATAPPTPRASCPRPC
jgi:hypothetical protein